MEQSMLLNFFGGVSQDGFGWAVDFEKVLYELARWLVPIGICLLAEGVWLEKWRKIELLSCYRYETVRVWWRRKFVRGLGNGIFTAAVMFLAAMTVDVAGGVGIVEEGWGALVLWLAHIVTIVAFFLVLDLGKLKGLAPAILLLVEGVTFLLGFVHVGTARFMYGMWGMYFQSEWHFGGTGVPVLSSLLAEGILLVLAYLLGNSVLAKSKQKYGGRYEYGD